MDLLTILVIAGLLRRLGLRPERAILYAWHPLLILEVGSSGHVDVVAIFFLMLALWARVGGRPVRAGFLLACAVLTKFYALVALPALLRPERRRDLRLPLALVVTASLAYLPFLGVGARFLGYVGGDVQEEGIAWATVTTSMSGPSGWWCGAIRRGRIGREPCRSTGAQVYAALLVATMGALAGWCWLRPLPSPRAIAARVLLLFTIFMVLATPSYPWYSLLVLPFVPFVGRRLMFPALAVVCGAGFLYLQWWWPGGAPWASAIAYGGGALALLAVAISAIVARRRRGLPIAGSWGTMWGRWRELAAGPLRRLPRSQGWGRSDGG